MSPASRSVVSSTSTRRPQRRLTRPTSPGGSRSVSIALDVVVGRRLRGEPDRSGGREHPEPVPLGFESRRDHGEERGNHARQDLGAVPLGVRNLRPPLGRRAARLGNGVTDALPDVTYFHDSHSPHARDGVPAS